MTTGTDAGSARTTEAMADAGGLPARVVEELVARKETVACRGVADRRAARRDHRGRARAGGPPRGLIVYATELKAELAGVPDDLLSARGPVRDPDVAAALAAGARERCGADWGLATTVVAGPDPQDGVPVGTVFIALAGPRTVVRRLALDGERAAVRSRTVNAALTMLLEALTAQE